VFGIFVVLLQAKVATAIMQYSVAHIAMLAHEPWQEDLLWQTLADMGFEAFEDDKAYIQTSLLSPDTDWAAVLAPYPWARLLNVSDCPDENWNATWEAEHPVMELPLGIRIMPHCAFGAGYHETTGMILDALMAHTPQGAAVLDNGCGTGVLGIMAARCGAEHVTMVDIDEHSVRNAEENIALNKELIAHSQFRILQGDTPPEGRYDLILSNIHRNILLAQMPLYARYLNQGGEVWLSGFYEVDCPALVQAAREAGLQVLETMQRGEWRMMRLEQRPLR